MKPISPSTMNDYSIETPISATLIGIELTTDHAARLSAGETICVQASSGLLIQLVVHDGHVEAVRESMSEDKSRLRDESR